MSMEIVKSDAIVLRSIKHSETSRIISVYTELKGRISLLAKGARKAKPHVPMDTFSLLNVVYRYKSSREIQLLTSVESLNSFLSIRDNLNKSSIAFQMCELTLRTTEAEDSNIMLFKALKDSLTGLNEASKNFINFLWYFEIRLLEAIGFGIEVESCRHCGKNADASGPNRANFSFEQGGLLCPECSKLDEKSVTLRPETLKTLQFILKQSPDKLERISVSNDAAKQLNDVLAGYFRHHIEDMRRLNSRKLTALVNR